MSTTSISMTFLHPARVVDVAAAAIQQDDMTAVDESMATYKDLVVATYSRNSLLEHRAAGVVRGLKPGGLDYLVVASENMAHSHKWYAHGLADGGLLQAIAGLRALLSSIGREPSASGFMDWGQLGDYERPLLDKPPASLEEAIRRNKQYLEESTGEDARALIGFLQAHLALLEYAQEHELGAVYCVMNA